MLRKISWAGGNCPSYPQSSRTLEELAGLKLQPCQIARITEKVGIELSSYQNHVQKYNEPLLEDAVKRASVLSVDGGRVQIRAEDQPPGVHQPQWKETKVAHLQIMESQSHPEDPQPEVPNAFVDPHHVKALVNQLGGYGRTAQECERISLPKQARKTPKKKKDNVLIKSCLATVASAEEFAPIVRNEAKRLEMEKAEHKIFLADGGSPNWIIYEKFFSHWYAALDFVHLVEHLFLVAGAVCKKPKEAWKLYHNLVTLAWKGKPNKIISILNNHQQRIGIPEKNLAENHPRRILQRTIKYIQDNQNRMDYPAIRKKGLPVSSCRVESLIKQINQRVKASDKFWVIPKLKAVLQIRAAELSTTKQWENFWYQKIAA